MSEELWTELSATMRALRVGAGRSLRQVERESGWGRGTLSQLENGRARPNRAQVEWYDAHLGGDQLLMSMYAEARGAHGSLSPRTPGPAVIDGDAFEVTGATLAAGETVVAGSTVRAGWKLRNAGSVPWADRAIARVGAPAALRLISSAASVPVPDCQADEIVDVSFEIAVPNAIGTLAAYWHIVDRDGRPCFEPPSLLPVTLLAR